MIATLEQSSLSDAISTLFGLEFLLLIILSRLKRAPGQAPITYAKGWFTRPERRQLCATDDSVLITCTFPLRNKKYLSQRPGAIFVPARLL